MKTSKYDKLKLNEKGGKGIQNMNLNT